MISAKNNVTNKHAPTRTSTGAVEPTGGVDAIQRSRLITNDGLRSLRKYVQETVNHMPATASNPPSTISPLSSTTGISEARGNCSAEKVGDKRRVSGDVNGDKSKMIKKTRTTYGGVQEAKSVSPTSPSELSMNFGQADTNTARI